MWHNVKIEKKKKEWLDVLTLIENNFIFDITTWNFQCWEFLLPLRNFYLKVF